MKLIDYAHKMGISYKTAWRWYRAGKLPGKQMDTGTILVMEDEPERHVPTKVAAYARVSSAENTSNLDSQAERLVAYCAARGYHVAKVVKEVGSGINDSRPQFLALLADQDIGTIVVEHQDRATRFGFRYIETLLKTNGRTLEVVNQAENSTEDLLADLTAIISSFCARLYGQRWAKRKTEKIIQELEAEHATS
ncbi:MAG: IS607 family transposase [Ktedonobacteraceae bacterium]